MVLGQVGMALHHKLAHVLGGSFDLPHAETHAILLSHTIGYNAQADGLAPLATLLDGRVGPGLHAFAGSLGAPIALRDVGIEGEAYLFATPQHLMSSPTMMNDLPRQGCWTAIVWNARRLPSRS
jgi:maleylacetate reductase